MKIVINGDAVTLNVQVSNVSGVVETLGLSERLIIVEHNGAILKKTDWPNVGVNEKDVFEIVHFVGGG
ncbi:MAG: sulfur carrier protein ThiS [Bacilli bacterium]